MYDDVLKMKVRILAGDNFATYANVNGIPVGERDEVERKWNEVLAEVKENLHKLNIV